MKLLLSEVTFVSAIPFKGSPQVFVGTGESWRGWSVYADTNSREVVVDVPGAPSRRRIRIPFEQVKFYVAAGLATKAVVDDGWAKVED